MNDPSQGPPAPYPPLPTQQVLDIARTFFLIVEAQAAASTVQYGATHHCMSLYSTAQNSAARTRT